MASTRLSETLLLKTKISRLTSVANFRPYIYFVLQILNVFLLLKEKEKANQAGIGSSNQSEENKEQEVMREELGLMSLLINLLIVGEQDEFTLTELKDTVMAYARGDVPEVVTVLNKEDMDKFNKASALEKVHIHVHNLNIT